jgi:PhoH-like ATPase
MDEIEQDQSWVEELRKSGGQPIELCLQLQCEDLWVNDPVVINKDILARIVANNKGGLMIKVVPSNKKVHALGVTPRGFEQFFAMDLLLDKTVQCVTLWGIAGSGKTFLCMAAALHMVNEGNFDNIHLLKPVSHVGKTTGFLPGTQEEKLSPFLASMTQHLDKIVGPHNSQELVDSVTEEGVEYQRGRNYENCILIIDEAQNMSKHEMLTMLTRVCENSRIFICGDTSQVDEYKLKLDNGITMVLETFRKQMDHDIADVRFHKSERKGISLKAVERLSDLP